MLGNKVIMDLIFPYHHLKYEIKRSNKFCNYWRVARDIDYIEYFKQIFETTQGEQTK